MKKNRKLLSFEEKVYAAVRNIPRGKVSTYKAVAKVIGRPNAFRAVGNVLNKNPQVPRVPCHRVILSSGLLGGYARGVAAKAKLLRREGVLVEKNRVALKEFGFRIERRPQFS